MRPTALIALSILMAATASAETTRPEILAHRGASAYAPENTMPAIDLAWKMNSDGAEFDVHLTSDKRVFLMHDKTTSRTTPGTDYIIAETPADVLAKLDAGAWFDPKFAGTKSPFFEDLFTSLPPKGQLICEIKSDADTVGPVREIVDKFGKRDRMVIISFKMDVCREARKQMPDVPVYFLKSTEKTRETKKPIPHREDLIESALQEKLTGLDLNYLGLTREFVKKAHDAGLKVIAWTVDEPDDIRRMAEIGVDGITTNKPDLALEIVSKTAKPRE